MLASCWSWPYLWKKGIRREVIAPFSNLKRGRCSCRIGLSAANRVSIYWELSIASPPESGALVSLGPRAPLLCCNETVHCVSRCWPDPAAVWIPSRANCEAISAGRGLIEPDAVLSVLFRWGCDQLRPSAGTAPNCFADVAVLGSVVPSWGLCCGLLAACKPFALLWWSNVL